MSDHSRDFYKPTLLCGVQITCKTSTVQTSHNIYTPQNQLKQVPFPLDHTNDSKMVESRHYVNRKHWIINLLEYEYSMEWHFIMQGSPLMRGTSLKGPLDRGPVC